MKMPLAGCRVLIVEDDFIIAECIADAIHDAGGHVVGSFDTMIEALERLGDIKAVDGAVLDVGLGSEASYPLADALQATRIPFLFLTGLRKSDLPERFSDVPHLQKPFTAKALVHALLNGGLRTSQSPA